MGRTGSGTVKALCTNNHNDVCSNENWLNSTGRMYWKSREQLGLQIVAYSIIEGVSSPCSQCRLRSYFFQLHVTPHDKISCSSGQWVTMIKFCVETFIWCPIVPVNEMRHYWVTKRFPLAGQSASTCPYHPISSSDAPFLFNCEIKVAKYTKF